MKLLRSADYHTLYNKTLISLLYNCRRQLAGERNWTIYHLHHFLKPFCWLYQMFRYIRQEIGRGFKLKYDINRGSARANLLKKLGV